MLETAGIPTITLSNDAFAPTAQAIATMLGMPSDYVAGRFVWLPHPTENLTSEQANALIDERIGEIRLALTGRRLSDRSNRGVSTNDPLSLAMEVVADLTSSLRKDGATLELESYADGVLSGRVTISTVCGDDGACLIPTQQLERMVEAILRPHLPDLRSVKLNEGLSP